MSYLDHIRACNARDMGRFRPFVLAGRAVGWVRDDTAARLADLPSFAVDRACVRLDEPLALDEACAELTARWGYPGPRGERFRVVERWGFEPIATIDRALVSVFGLRGFGIHVNGVAHGGAALWIGRRAPDRAVSPGKLDNMVAGGQPAGLSLMDNLVKEAAEEAGLPEDLARTAKPVGAVSYCLEDEWGLKPDTMFCFDLAMPDGITPRNADGEVESFALMEAAEALRRVRDTDDFKYNVNLVILDFAIRHGLLSPETEPDYAEIVRGLRQGW